MWNAMCNVIVCAILLLSIYDMRMINIKWLTSLNCVYVVSVGPMRFDWAAGFGSGNVVMGKMLSPSLLDADRSVMQFWMYFIDVFEHYSKYVSIMRFVYCKTTQFYTQSKSIINKLLSTCIYVFTCCGFSQKGTKRFSSQRSPLQMNDKVRNALCLSVELTSNVGRGRDRGTSCSLLKLGTQRHSLKSTIKCKPMKCLCIWGRECGTRSTSRINCIFHSTREINEFWFVFVVVEP